jgi:hypothetical protein
MSTHIATPTLAGLPLELKEIIFGYVLEIECQNRVRLACESMRTRHVCSIYRPSLRTVNKRIGTEFGTFFSQKVIFVVWSPDELFREPIWKNHEKAMRSFVNIEVQVDHRALAKSEGKLQIAKLQLHERSVITFVLSSELLWEVMDGPRSLRSHERIITVLQALQSAWKNSVITIASLDILSKYKAKSAVTKSGQCLMNHFETQAAWRIEFGPDMIVNKIVKEYCPVPW